MGMVREVQHALWSALPYDIALIVAFKLFRTWPDVRDKASQSQKACNPAHPGRCTLNGTSDHALRMPLTPFSFKNAVSLETDDARNKAQSLAFHKEAESPQLVPGIVCGINFATREFSLY